MNSRLKRAVFLDRDGVINHDAGYTSSISDFKFIEGIFELVQTAIQQDFLVIVITNQAGIGRGFYSEQDFLNLTAWMLDQFKDAGSPITDVFFCPYHPKYGINEYKIDSVDRKPNPGMIIKAAEKYAIDLPASIMIGDKASDMQAAQAAGINNRWLFNVDQIQESLNSYETQVIFSLGEANKLLKSLR